tara:strand:+ start:9175 stop:9417 length:243 start_codon:yes stop_codon:yes gene_type:complete
MNRNFVKKNKIYLAIFLFIFLYFLILQFKPSLIFENDGSLRHFGMGYSKRSIIPAWLFAIILAIFSYFSVLYYSSNNIYF